MSQHRLNHLSLISIESELLWKQNFDNLIHEFACKRSMQSDFIVSVSVT